MVSECRFGATTACACQFQGMRPPSARIKLAFGLPAFHEDKSMTQAVRHPSENEKALDRCDGDAGISSNETSFAHIFGG